MRVIIISLVILFTVKCGAFSESYKEYIQEGDQYYSSFDNQSALKYYLKASDESPDSYDVLFRLSRTYNDLGEEYYEYHKKDSSRIMINFALEYSQKMVKDYPDSSASYAFLAMSFGNQALYEGGKEQIKLAHKIEENAKKSLKLNSRQYLSYIILGIYYRKIADLSWFDKLFANTFFGSVPEGTFEESVQMLKKALELYPKTIVASYQLALTYEAMGDKKSEAELLRKLLKYPRNNFRDKFAIMKAKNKLIKL
jgi:tetratricopeptide (TPR) repeat protein